MVSKLVDSTCSPGSAARPLPALVWVPIGWMTGQPVMGLARPAAPGMPARLTSAPACPGAWCVLLAPMPGVAPPGLDAVPRAGTPAAPPPSCG